MKELAVYSYSNPDPILCEFQKIFSSLCYILHFKLHYTMYIYYIILILFNYSILQGLLLFCY